MQFGLFDHLERASDRTLSTQFTERLNFLAAADEAGFYCLHVAEHHATPLNMISVPGAYLGAAARATRHIRLGPLVYLLPLYSPLRLAEEICILDHMSDGRLDVGVGRGVSPFEMGYHKVEHDQSREIFFDAYECLKAALTTDTFSYRGKFFDYQDVPMALRPLQQPTPPFWYGSSNTTGAAWAGAEGMHFTTNGAAAKAKENIDAFRAALAARGAAQHPKPEFTGGTAIGLLRHIVVADTDEAAQQIAEPAIEYHAKNLNWLRARHGVTKSRVAASVVASADRHLFQRADSFESWRDAGMLVAGSPRTVAAELSRQAGMLGINYLIAYLFFGCMSLADAKRSLELFASDVMPALRDGARANPATAADSAAAAG